MPYDYATEKPFIFTDEGQRMFLRIRDKFQQLFEFSGAARLDKAIAGNSGSSWSMLACVDRLEELGEIQRVTSSDKFATQHQVYISARSND